MQVFIEEAIANYIRESNDHKIDFLELPNTTEETVGARKHPGKLSHEKASEVLIEYLERILV